MNTQDPKYQEKSKAISSAEPNYSSQFEVRYPVPKIKYLLCKFREAKEMKVLLSFQNSLQEIKYIVKYVIFEN